MLHIRKKSSNFAHENMAAPDKNIVLWYIFRCDRKISKVEETLTAAGADYYIPKKKAVRTFAGKKKEVYLPVLTSTVFIHGSWHEVDALKKRHEQVLFYKFWPIKYSRKEYEPMWVREDELQNFRRVCDQMDEDIVFLSEEEAARLKGKRVRVRGGAFAGVEGVVLHKRGKGNRVVVQLSNLAYVSTAEVKPDDLEIIS